MIRQSIFRQLAVWALIASAMFSITSSNASVYDNQACGGVCKNFDPGLEVTHFDSFHREVRLTDAPPYIVSSSKNLPVLQIAVINESALLSDQQVRSIVKSCAKQVKKHFAPYYGLTAKIVIAQSANEIDWETHAALIFTDETPDLHAFGFHSIQDSTFYNGDDIASELTVYPPLPNGTPFMIIQVEICRENSLPVDPLSTLTFENQVCMTTSHEILETLGNYAINKWYGYTDVFTTNLYSGEVCDPVENTGYFVEGLMVSDFVFPSFFVGSEGVGPYDFLNVVPAPFTSFLGGSLEPYFGIISNQGDNRRSAPNPFGNGKGNPVPFDNPSGGVEKPWGKPKNG